MNSYINHSFLLRGFINTVPLKSITILFNPVSSQHILPGYIKNAAIDYKRDTPRKSHANE